MYLWRVGNSLKVESNYPGPQLNLANIMTSFSSTEWTFIGISIGWTAFTWKYTF